MLLLFASFTLHSCTLFFDAFLRNMTNEKAIVDVYLLNKEDMKTLPKKVKVANQIVDFKSGYKKHFDSNQNVMWLNTEHFQFELLPNTSADLEDMAGEFINSFPRGDVRVTVTTQNRTDTLLNGIRDFRHSLFGYKNKLFTPILYYDVK